MTLHKWSLYAFFAITNLFAIHSANALPFSITPSPTAPFPTTMVLGTTVYATYIVQNNTSTARQNNYVKYLPPNVYILPSGCGNPFNLAAKGQNGDSCELNLAITGAVERNDANIHNHLFVCFPGGITCAGTEYPLNVTVLSSIGISGINALAHQDNTIYAGGLNSSNKGGMWNFITDTWTSIFTGATSSPVEAITTSQNNPVYFGGEVYNAGQYYSAWVYAYDTNSLSSTDTGFMSTTSATKMNSLTMNGSTLYAGGIDSTGQQGQAWIYSSGVWTSLGITNTDITEVTTVMYSPVKAYLLAAELNNGAGTVSQNPYAQIQYYNGTTWTTIPLPTSDESPYFIRINALAVDSVGNVYIGGINSNQEAAVWEYNGTSWTILTPPPTVPTSEIYSLAFNNDGILFAGGFDGNIGQVWYYSNNEWISMNLMGSSLVESMTIDSTNLLYAGGLAENNLSGIWSMSANVS